MGEYIRNYSQIYHTFFPFKHDEQWLALVSRSYTCTEIMRLPSCEFIGGEQPAGNGFCPVEFYVPRYRRWTTNSLDGDLTGKTYSGRTYDHSTINWINEMEGGNYEPEFIWSMLITRTRNKIMPNTRAARLENFLNTEKCFRCLKMYDVSQLRKWYGEPHVVGYDDTDGDPIIESTISPVCQECRLILLKIN